MNSTWEDGFLGLLWGFCFFILVAIIAFIANDKKVTRYSLGSYNVTSVCIVKEIEWYEDDKIFIDHSITLEEAIHLVDSLNKTLK